jgi:hypothetical protein
MQGRQGREEEPWDKYASQRLEALSSTSKHRAVPQRPPNMAHVSGPPKTPRVGRLKRQDAPPRSLRQRLMFGGCGLAIFAILVTVGSYIGFNLFSATSNSSGAAVSVVNFLGAVENTNYAQAYTYLSPAITLRLSPEQFSTQAKNDDSCFGAVKDYKLVENSTVYQASNQSYKYSYTITRAKLKQPYQLQLTLQQDPNAQNTWKITSYGNDLGSTGQTVTSCQT